MVKKEELTVKRFKLKISARISTVLTFILYLYQNPVNNFPRKHPLAYTFLLFLNNLQFRGNFVFVSRSRLGRLVPSPPREPRETERHLGVVAQVLERSA